MESAYETYTQPPTEQLQNYACTNTFKKKCIFSSQTSDVCLLMMYVVGFHSINNVIFHPLCKTCRLSSNWLFLISVYYVSLTNYEHVDVITLIIYFNYVVYVYDFIILCYKEASIWACLVVQSCLRRYDMNNMMVVMFQHSVTKLWFRRF